MKRDPLFVRAGRMTLLLLLALLLLSSCRGKRDALIDDNELLFAHAQALIAQRDFSQAERKLGDIGLVSPVPPEMDPQIKLALADSYFYQFGLINAVEAQSRYEQFLSFYPLHPRANYARYQIGVCLFLQSEDPENDQEYTLRAMEHFDAMVRDLPDGDPWQMAAKGQRIKAFDKLAAHEWAVANFYLSKERYPGVIRRLNKLVDRYPGTRFREDALVELMRTYIAVGDPEQARLTLGRLQADYPTRASSDEVHQLIPAIEGREAGGAGELG